MKRPSLLTLSNITETASDNEPGSSSYQSDLKYFLPQLEDDSPAVQRDAVNFQNVMKQAVAADQQPVSPVSGVEQSVFQAALSEPF